VVLAVVLEAGCATTRPVASGAPDLSGAWQLILPAGFQHRITITAKGDGRYRFSGPALSFDGIYELRGNSLVMVVPDDPRLTEFVWHLDDSSHLTLVEEPPAEKTGAGYLTATLTRIE
jgi:hypothetical protein